MNVNYLKMGKTWLLVFLFFIVGVTNAQAFELADKLTLNGFLRQTAVMSIGTANSRLEDYQATEGSGDKPDFNLIRTMVQLELNYQPTDVLRFYMKGRATHDQTYMWQSDLGRYNTTPWTYDHTGWDLKTGYGEDSFMAEIWEVWANIEMDLLWIRLGKQQIAWGDLPGVRIADKVNPLDKSWHLTNEPEEYENIRIPEWAVRVYFTFPETMTGFFNEVFIDGYWNPGNIHPDIQPAPGSPYMNAYSGNPNEMSGGPGGFRNYPTGAPQPDPDFILHGEEDEYGIRLGFNVDEFQVTFNFMSMYNDFPLWDFNNAPVQTTVGGGPPRWENLNVGTIYPEIDVYAMTMSYAFSNPINTSVTFEGSYTPNQPWQANAPGPPSVAEGKYYRTAIYLDRNVFFMNSLSRFFSPQVCVSCITGTGSMKRTVTL
jgi:hypothetical protein